MKHINIIIFICLLATGCKQNDLPAIIDSSPVFVFEGMIGSNNVLYEAGNNNMYMKTSFVKNAFGLYQLSGILGQDNCDTCEPFISIVFNSNTLNGNTYSYNSNFWQANKIVNSFSLDTGSIVSQKVVNCIPTNTIGGTTYYWTDFTGTTSILFNPQFVMQGSGIKNIRMVTNAGGFSDTITQSLSNNIAFITDSFDIFKDTLTSVNTNSNATGNVIWNWGDNSSNSNGTNATHTYTNSGTYFITATIINTDSVVLRKKISITNTSLKIFPSFNMTISNSPTTAKQNENTGIITLKKNGKIYKSYKSNSNQNQSNNKVFTILQSLDGENNLQGQKTKVFDANINLYLYNIDNNADSIKVQSTKCVFAVAVPN